MNTQDAKSPKGNQTVYQQVVDTAIQEALDSGFLMAQHEGMLKIYAKFGKDVVDITLTSSQDAEKINQTKASY